VRPYLRRIRRNKSQLSRGNARQRVTSKEVAWKDPRGLITDLAPAGRTNIRKLGKIKGLILPCEVVIQLVASVSDKSFFLKVMGA
jgi:hypothetical protein